MGIRRPRQLAKLDRCIPGPVRAESTRDAFKSWMRIDAVYAGGSRSSTFRTAVNRGLPRSLRFAISRAAG